LIEELARKIKIYRGATIAENPNTLSQPQRNAQKDLTSGFG